LLSDPVLTIEKPFSAVIVSDPLSMAPSAPITKSLEWSVVKETLADVEVPELVIGPASKGEAEFSP
jgi:hypothetical protein